MKKWSLHERWLEGKGLIIKSFQRQSKLHFNYIFQRYFFPKMHYQSRNTHKCIMSPVNEVNVDFISHESDAAVKG